VLPPSPSDELSEEVGEGSPPDDGEKARFASYYGGTAEEAQLRALKRGVVKFNVKPKDVRARMLQAAAGAAAHPPHPPPFSSPRPAP
jgi:hypothetical protein